MKKLFKKLLLYVTFAFLVAEAGIAVWDFIVNYWPEVQENHDALWFNWIDVAATWRICVYFMCPLVLWGITAYLILQKRYLSELRFSLIVVNCVSILMMISAGVLDASLTEFNIYVRIFNLLTLAMLWFNLGYTMRSLWRHTYYTKRHHHHHHHHHHDKHNWDNVTSARG